MNRVAGTLKAAFLVLLLAGCQTIDTDTGLFLTTTPGGGGGGSSSAGISPTTIDNSSAFTVSWANPGNLSFVQFHLNDQAAFSQSAVEGFYVNAQFVTSPVTCQYLYGSPASINCTTSGGQSLGTRIFSFNLTNTVYGIISRCRYDFTISLDPICDNTVIPLRFTIPSPPPSGGGGSSSTGISPTTIDNSSAFTVSWANPGNLSFVQFHLNDQAAFSQSAVEGFYVNAQFVTSPVTCQYLYGSPPSINCTPSGGQSQGTRTFSYNLNNSVYGIISRCRYDFTISLDPICDNTVIPLRFTIP